MASLSVCTPVGISRFVMEELLTFACGCVADEGWLTLEEKECVSGLLGFFPPRLPVFVGGMRGIPISDLQFGRQGKKNYGASVARNEMSRTDLLD